MRSAPGVAAGLLAVTFLVVGCGGGESDEQTASVPTMRVAERPLRPAAQSTATTTTDRFAQGLPARTRSTTAVPPAPDTAGALAAESIPAVVALHNLAAAVGRPLDLPRGALHAQAVDVRSMLSRLQQGLGQSPQQTRAELAGVLSGYRVIAESLAHRAQPLTPASRRRLAVLDVRWRRALRKIERRSGADLVALIPALPRPHVPAPARPPEPTR